VTFELVGSINYQLGNSVATRSRGKIVGVFVDPTDELVDHAVSIAELDAIQFHETSPERADHLRRFSGVETWVALAIKTRADLDTAHRYAGAADRLIYDAKTPPGAALPGGMGLRFDWSLLDGFRHPLPWGLSGGLDPANVATAIAHTRAPLVDVSSGVESAPGVKDVDKIAAFLKASRA
ncbi:MAG TPA: phosphoribosylanthranilate isomerase, partial [Sphingomonas sp.]|jgi:phosphoribosylanthranilate isomerase